VRQHTFTTFLDRTIATAQKATVVILKFYALVFLLAIVAILYEIVARALGYATVLSVELSGYVMASMVAWASTYTLFQRTHIRIDLLYVRRSNAIKNLLDVMSIFLFFLVAVFLAWSSLSLMLESVEYGLVSNTTLRIPMWIPQLSWGLGFAWLAVCSALLTIKSTVAWANNDRDAVATAVGATEESPL